MKASTLGRMGEELALAYLRALGFVCRDRRWRRGGGEIDLVMQRADLTVFVEVKARGPGSLGRAVEAVSPRQLARLRRLARRWCVENAPTPRLRLDVVTIDVRPNARGLVLQHHTDVR
jgi:putative endonuclease